MSNLSQSKDVECNIAHALSNEERLIIIKMLLNIDEMTVTQIQSELFLEQSTVSHHLGILKKSGLLVDCRDGRTKKYRISDNYNDILNKIFHLIQEK